MSTHTSTCPLCEAMCGLRIATSEGRITSVRGDGEDPLSRGFLCRKALGLKDLHEDPDRLRRPLARDGSHWREMGWPEALDLAADRLAAVRAEHGAASVAYYTGNPNLHSYGVQIAELGFVRTLGTPNVVSTASMDVRPHAFAAYHVFGHQYLLAVPDVDRTDFLLIVGANPVESNGSLMGAPGFVRRMAAIRRRGGTTVVIDPRRTRTAARADRHYYVWPGTDALLLAALVRTLLEERLVTPGRLAERCTGLDELRAALEPFEPERVARQVGIEADAIRRLARDFAGARSAVAYGRFGACTQEFGATTCWLLLVLNVLTGNLDQPGGAMFAKPAADVVRWGTLLGRRGSFGAWSSRVRGLSEFGGELPVAVLAEEIDTPGPGQVRGLITSAGNPVLSTPNGRRLERAIEGLDAYVAIDFYLNESTRHADVILPPTFALERDHYDLTYRAFGVRDTTRYTEAVLDPEPGSLHDWEIYAELGRRLASRRGGPAGRLGALFWRMFRRITPRPLLGLFLATGPYGVLARPFGPRLTLSRLAREEHARDLGALEPRLPRLLATRGRRIHLCPSVYQADVERLLRKMRAEDAPGNGEMVLIGRRHVADNNSWMHNAPAVARGPDRCTLLVHPRTAARLGLEAGGRAELASRVGTVVAPVELTEKIHPGVVSLPHGYGHGRVGTRLRVASRRPGVSVNDVTDELRLDELSGTVSFSGVRVSVRPVP